MDKDIEKQQELQSAYDSFQRASQNRDEDPETFEQTRFRYYGLKNGKAWMDQERKVIADKKLSPVLDGYRRQYNDLENQGAVQQGYTDSIAAIRNKQSSLKDGVSKNTDFLGNLLDDKKQKISAFNRYIELTDPITATPVAQQTDNIIVRYFAAFPSSFITILDIVIAILVILLLVLILNKSKLAYRGLMSRFNSGYSTPITTP